MKTTLLLGAGATCAQAKAEGMQNNELPPVDTTLFQRAADLQLDELPKLQASLDICVASSLAEEVFNEAFERAINEPKNIIAAKGTYRLLLRLFLKTIAQTTNELNCHTKGGLQGLVKQLVAAQSGSVFHDLQIITFNYDVLAEKCLANLSKRNPAIGPTYIDIHDCYIVDFGHRYLPPPDGFPTDRFESSMSERTIPILKLHGSLNWYLGGDPLCGGIDPIPDDDCALLCYEGKQIYTRPDITLTVNEDSGRKSKYYLLPAIVPPVFDKNQFLSRVLKLVWQKAEDALTMTQQLIVFGYSLPKADCKARKMLKESLTKNNGLQRLDIIDIDPEVCSRWKAVTDKVPVEHFASVDEFLASEVSQGL